MANLNLILDPNSPSIRIRNVYMNSWGHNPNVNEQKRFMAIGTKPNGGNTPYTQQVVLKNFALNGSDNDFNRNGNQRNNLNNQVWEMMRLDGYTDLFVFRQGNSYIVAPDGNSPLVYTKDFTNDRTGTAYDIANDPERIIWECRQLPNWAGDSEGAPRPWKIRKYKSTTQQVFDIQYWNMIENTPIQTIKIRQEAQNWDNKTSPLLNATIQNDIGCQVWYLEMVRVPITYYHYKGLKITAKNLNSASTSPQNNTLANESIKLWNSPIGGNLLASLDSSGLYCTIPASPDASPTSTNTVYISALRTVDGTVNNESYNGLQGITASSTKQTIKFFYGDPEGGGSGEVSDEGG